MTVINGTSPLYYMNGTTTFSGTDGDYKEISHNANLELANGTYAFSFNAKNVTDFNAIFSKDATDYGDGGHLLAYIKNEELIVRFQSENSYKYLKVDEALKADTDYHLAITFGDEGIKVYVDGQLKRAEPTFKQSMEANTENLVIGASNHTRSDNSQDAKYEFEGTISDFAIYGRDFNEQEIADLSGNAHADYHVALEKFMPGFRQLHHASDEIEDIADSFGYTHHGTKSMKNIVEGTDGDDAMNGTANADFLNGLIGDDTLNGNAGNDELQGYYGNDVLNGGAGNDLLDGGHGEDIVNGGDGDDFIISRADAREPNITNVPFRDEEDPLGELDAATGKLYPNQPIPADDVLTGGAGADTFYFQTLINAKDRYLEKHTQDNGDIRWHGVAGENDKLHDHWVDGIGNDVITDYSRTEGDKIIIEGHTTEILDITHHDENGDGVMDYSKIHLYSDQGNNGGAHQYDLLGTIKVYGDLLRDGEVETDAGVAYGIVKNIDGLDEAIKPLDMGTDRGEIAPLADDTPVNFGVVDGISPIFGLHGDYKFTGEDEDYLDIPHQQNLMIPNGTYAMTFTANDLEGIQALFSKDARGNRDGGHLKAYLDGDDLVVRMQSYDNEKHLKVKDFVQANQEYKLAISFGDGGLKVYVDGQLKASDTSFTQSMENNYEYIVIGASGAARNDDGDNARHEFNGTISDFLVYDQALSDATIANLSNLTEISYNLVGDNSDESIKGGYSEDVIAGGEGNDTISGGDESDIIYGDAGNDLLFGGKHDDKLFGGTGDDTINGNSGNDVIRGNAGNDLLYGNVGHDFITGNDGLDTISAGSGDDYVNGGNDADLIYGGAGADTLQGSSGMDTILGNTGGDTIDGGTGNDSLFGNSGQDKIYAGNGHDYVNGGTDSDVIEGNAGNDSLYGSDGNDTIIGGTGVDRLKGDSGNDDFVWGAANESGIGAGNRDVIADFLAGSDEIDLSGLSGNLVFRSGGNGSSDFFGNVAQVAYEASAGSNTIVHVDINGDRTTDFEIELEGNISLTSGDFIL